MRLRAFAFLFTLCISCLPAQHIAAREKPVQVADLTVEVAANGETNYWFAFNEGDDIIVTFRQEKARRGTELQILEYPGISRFILSPAQASKTHTIPGVKKGIFQFRLSRKESGAGSARLTIARRPANDKRIKFNTAVKWKTIADTTYTEETENYILKADTQVNMVMDRVARVHSRTAMNLSSNETVVDFSIPAGTTVFSMFIGVGEEGAKAYSEAVQKFLHSTAKVSLAIPNVGPLVALAIEGINFFTIPTGSDNVIYALFDNQEDLEKWRRSPKAVKPVRQGDVVMDQARFFKPLPHYWLYLKNDNIRDEIDVEIKVAAISIHSTTGKRTVKKPRYGVREVPYIDW